MNTHGFRLVRETANGSYREKDGDFVRILLIEGMINIKTLIEGIRSLGIDEKLRERLVQWAQYTAEEL